MNGLAIGGVDEETLPTLDELNAQGNETKTEDLPSLAQLNAETTDKTTDVPKEATPESLPSIASLNGEEPAPSDSSAGELPSLAQLNGEEKPAEPPKENIGILETMRREKNAELGTDMGGWETAAHYTPVVGKMLDANEMRKENVAKRLAMGEVKDPLEIVRLARTIDIDPEKLQQVIDASDSGQRSIAGFRQAPNVEVLKKGVAELAMPLFKARIEAREKAQQSLENAEELNWAEKVGKGFLGTAGTVAEFATPVTMALGTAGNILTRGGAAAQDVYTLDENGNPVLVKEGDKSEGAVAKAILGGVAEQTIWSSPLVGSMLKAGGKAIMKAIPGAEKFVAGAAKKTLGSIGKAADVFGIVDRTDMAAEKSRLKDHGFFQNEDPTWAATHTPLSRPPTPRRARQSAPITSRPNRHERGNVWDNMW